MNGRGGRRVGQDVDEVRIHHVVVEQVKDAHSVRPICSREAAAQAVSARSERIQSVSLSVPPPPDQPTRVYGVEVDVDGLRSVGVDLHHGRGGEHQDVRAGRVLRGAQLRRLHVERRAAAEH